MVSESETPKAHIVDVPSAAYALAECGARLCPEGVNVGIAANSCEVSVTFKAPLSWKGSEAREMDGILQCVRQKCTEVTIRIRTSSSPEERCLSVPPRSKHILGLTSDVLHLCVCVNGWNAGVLARTGCASHPSIPGSDLPKRMDTRLVFLQQC